MIKETPIPVYCTRTQKLLARVDQHGIYLWCKVCRVEHYKRWSEMDRGEGLPVVGAECTLERVDRKEP